MRSLVVGGAFLILLSVPFERAQAPLPAPRSAQSGHSAQPADWKTLFSDDFEDGSTNRWIVSQPAGSSGTWSIESEGNNHVFSGQSPSWITLSAKYGVWADFRFKARVKLIRGGILLNYRFNGNAPYYFVTFGSTGVVLYRTPPDTEVARVAASYSLAQWYQIEIVGIGSNIKVYVDGTLKIDFTDSVAVVSGTVGFEAPGDSHVHIDDVGIDGPAWLNELVWVKTGGPIGGIGYDVRMRPDNPDIMYVTDTFSGINMSVDGGHTWFASNGGIPGLAGESGDAIPIFCLTIDSHDPQVVWAGTQNLRGIFKSLDGGKTWTKKDRGVAENTGITFRGITVDPGNPNVVYAAAEISSFVWAGKQLMGREFDLTKGVVYRSLDGGENWSAIWRGDNLARYIWIDPRDSSVIYISTGIFDREAANSDVLHGVPGGVGIVKSTDGGKTWRALNETNGLGSLYVGSLFMHPRNPEILLAGTGFIGGPEQSEGVYLSFDGGEHWQRGIDWESGRPVDDMITSVEFATSDPQIAYAARASSFFRSSDGGRSWRLMSGGPPSNYYGPPGIRTGNPIDLQVDPRNPDRVFINNYGGGNFLSEDGGRTWQVASKGYTGAQLLDIALDPRDGRRVFTIGRSGVFRGDDGGENWRGLNTYTGISATTTVALDPTGPEHILIADDFEGTIMQSLDGGLNWTLAFHNAEVHGIGSQGRHGFRALAFAPSNHRVVYGGMSLDLIQTGNGSPDPSFGMFKSSDGGTTWLEANDSSTRGQNINVIAVHPGNEAIVYAGTRQSGLFRTVDGGRNWQPLNQNLPARDVRALAIDASNPSVIYAGLEKYGVYKSLDGGSLWQPATAGLEAQAAVRDIVIDPSNPQVVYAADSRSGVYRSDDGGKLWLQINNGLRTRAVWALAISSDGGTLYAATYGEGVFRLDIKPQAEGAAATVSAATFLAGIAVAPESIASAFGQALAATTEQAPRLPLPTTLADVSVSVTDSDGQDRWAPLFFVSPLQINFQVPPGTGEGTAQVRVLRQNRVVARGDIRVERVAPGLFAANGDGHGVPAAGALRVADSGSQTPLAVFQCGAAPGSCEPVPIDLGEESDKVILVLYGTGIRAGTDTRVRIGGVEAVVEWTGPQGLVGLDQVNVRLPRELKGRGEVDLLLSVDGKTANPMKINVR